LLGKSQPLENFDAEVERERERGEMQREEKINVKSLFI
jgi:hypothetical protein